MSERILIIDDEIDICQLLTKFLEKKGYQCQYAGKARKGLELISKNDFDLVLCDFRLPDMDGTETIKEIKKLDHEIKIIVITGYSDVKTAVQCIKLGAFEYVTKPIHPEEILLTVKNALKAPTKEKKSPKKSTASRKAVQSTSETEFIQGKSSSSEKLMQLIRLLAPTNMSVLVEGESGTGKEMVANQIHDHSKRSKHPFVAIDCGALPKELAGSELFGHIKGSFTGAINDKTGHFEMADGGTLFLDEVGNLSYENQIKLLRVLQERKIRKIGDTKDISIDVRMIAASNDKLEELVKAGEFREDLYYRINEFLVEIPPLRKRQEDIMIFAENFLEMANKDLEKQVNGFEKEVINMLRFYQWPGNLRELKNVIKRSVLLTEGNKIKAEVLPEEIRSPNLIRTDQDENQEEEELNDLKSVAERAERKAIIKVLEQTNYNKTKTAKLLKIDRKTLYNKLDSYDIKFKKTYQ